MLGIVLSTSLAACYQFRRNIMGTLDRDESLSKRYSRQIATRHERLYGRGYQGPGSQEVFDHLSSKLRWKSEFVVLDVGSGLGGDAFRIARRFGASVTGLDASSEMVEVAKERLVSDGPGDADIEFVCGNVLDSNVLVSAKFDVVWTRDAGAFLTVEEKARAWERLFHAQPPEGQVLLTDYCVSAGPVNEVFISRMHAWGQHPITFSDYEEILRAAGYVNIVSEDRTPDLIASQREGLTLLQEEEESLRVEFGSSVYEALMDRWERKVSHSTSGQLRWLALTAERP
ncbi:methyltransferase domain-containing protein [Rathayibacter toxicus]|nr:methyltransferase domain-containing protein [Rathayibacter toxicus]